MRSRELTSQARPEHCAGKWDAKSSLRAVSDFVRVQAVDGGVAPGAQRRDNRPVAAWLKSLDEKIASVPEDVDLEARRGCSRAAASARALDRGDPLGWWDRRKQAAYSRATKACCRQNHLRERAPLAT